MKVILTRDVKGLGRVHDEVQVRDGHALNHLLPKKHAVPSTAAARKTADMRRREMSERAQVDAVLLAQNIAALAEERVIIRMKANEQGRLYDAVGAPEIAKAVKEQTRVDLPESVIKLEKPVKELGTVEVPLSAGDIFGSFSLEVEAE